MTQHYLTKGIIFKKEDRGEADRAFSVFTQDFGRVEIFGKAIRAIASKLKGGIEMFGVSELEFIQGKNRKTLTDATAINRFASIKASPEKMVIAAKVSLLLDDFIKGQELDERIWNAVIDFFQKLDSYRLAKNNYQLLYYYFFWNFVSVLGYRPELSVCAKCSQVLHQNAVYFSNKEGGVICRVCSQTPTDAKQIHADVVKVLRLFLKKEWQTITKLKLSSLSEKLLQDVSYNYCDHLTGIIN